MKKNILLLVISILFTVSAAELFLRLAKNPPYINFGWEGKYSSKRILKKLASDLQSEDQLRILLIGDSQAANSGDKISPALPAILLDRSLNKYKHLKICNTGELSDFNSAKTYTLAANGWGQDQQLINFSKVIKHLRPHIVLLWFTTGNDVWNNAFPTHWPLNGTPKPTFIIENDGVLLAEKEKIISPILNNSKLLLLLNQAISEYNKYKKQPAKRSGSAEPSYKIPSLFDPDGYWHNHVLPPS